jgi:hypothetical protein
MLRAELLEDRRLLAVVYWDGEAGTNSWHDAANWSNDTLPTAADDVVFDIPVATPVIMSQDVSLNSLDSQTASLILSGGVFRIDQSSSIAENFSVHGGTFEGTGDLTVSGDLAWTGGVIQGSGTLIADGTMTITGDNYKYLTRRLENRGTAIYDGVNFGFGSFTDGSATLVNAVGANFDLVGDSSIAQWTVSDHRFENHGILTHTGAGTSIIDGGTLESTGTVIVSEGTLRVQAGGSGSGNFQLTGGDFEVGGGSFSIGALSASANGVGVFRQSGGTVDIVSNAQVFNFTQTEGILEGTSDLTVSGNLAWTGGVIQGSGTLIADGTMTITGDNYKYLTRRLENRGTASYDGVNFGFGSFTDGSATLVNAVGANFDLVGDSSIAQWTVSDHRFENHGILTHTGAGTSIIDGGTLESTGTVIVSEGTLRVQAGGSGSGNFQLTGGDFEVGGGSFSIGALSASANGVGVFRQSGGTVDIVSNAQVFNFTQTEGILEGTSDLTVSGNLAWTGGVIQGSGTLIADGTMTITGDNYKYLTRRLENRGTAIYDGVNFGFGSFTDGSATLVNAVGANFDLVGDSSIAQWTVSDHRFENHGILTHTGAGTSIIDGGTLESTGTVIVSEGTLRVQLLVAAVRGTFN